MDKKQFEKLKNSSVGHNLLKSARLFNEYAFKTLKAKMDFKNFKQSHLQLFPHIPFEGITVVELAEKLEVSKQAVSVLVSELVDAGFLCKIPNPNDKRSSLVTFNKKSKHGIFEGMNHLSSLDSQLEEILNKNEFETLKKALPKIISHYQT